MEQHDDEHPGSRDPVGILLVAVICILTSWFVDRMTHDAPPPPRDLPIGICDGC